MDEEAARRTRGSGSVVAVAFAFAFASFLRRLLSSSSSFHRLFHSSRYSSLDSLPRRQPPDSKHVDPEHLRLPRGPQALPAGGLGVPCVEGGPRPPENGGPPLEPERDAAVVERGQRGPPRPRLGI